MTRVKVNLEDLIGAIIEGYEVIGVDRSDKRHPKMVVCCPVCKKDPEINGEAIYKSTYSHLMEGNKICECSNQPKRTKEVWDKVIRRKSVTADQEFIDYAEDWRGNSTYLKLKCKKCGYENSNCSVANYMRDRGCPKCKIVERSKSRIKNDDEMIASFLKLGIFAEGTRFELIPNGSNRRKWKVVCGTCNEEYIADRSNLQAGKRSCSCSSGGGIDVKLPVYFYVLHVYGKSKEFVGFGITNFLERRMYLHRKELSDHGLQCEVIRTVKFEDGKEALAVESKMKRELEIKNQGINGFRREAVDVSQMYNVLRYIEERLPTTL